MKIVYHHETTCTMLYKAQAKIEKVMTLMLLYSLRILV